MSACTKRLDASLAACGQRRLNATTYPDLVAHAHHEWIRREGQVLSIAALWVIGIRADGHYEHLGVWLDAGEIAASWSAVFRDLVQRGFHGVRYAVSDEDEGLARELRRYFSDAVHQRCQVHYLRNALAKVSSPALEQWLVAGLHDVWAAPTRAEAETRGRALVSVFRSPAPKLAEWLDTTLGDTPAFYVPSEAEARRRLRTTNVIEHDHAEVRRRTAVIRISPNAESFLRLAIALAVERTDQWAERRCPVMAQPATAAMKRLKGVSRIQLSFG